MLTTRLCLPDGLCWLPSLPLERSGRGAPAQHPRSKICQRDPSAWPARGVPGSSYPVICWAGRRCTATSPCERSTAPSTASTINSSMRCATRWPPRRWWPPGGLPAIEGADTVGANSRGYDTGKKINPRNRVVGSRTSGRCGWLCHGRGPGRGRSRSLGANLAKGTAPLEA
jgi:hypothetical protein